jgi:hypothetical protein
VADEVDGLADRVDGASPLAPRPRRSTANTVKCRASAGTTGVQYVRSLTPPWTSTSGGPEPVSSKAMGVPSAERTVCRFAAIMAPPGR